MYPARRWALVRKYSMADEMKAAILHGKEDLRLETVPRPHARPGELVLRVGAALTCGTDLKVYRRGYHARMLQPPIPFGHEVAGVVAEAGAGVTEFYEGDRVVALNSAPCNVCFWCRKGQQNLCDDLLFNNGAYAEYMRIPARIVASNTLPVPYNVKLEHAALVEPLACVIRGFEESGAQAGDIMAVIGAGPIGLMFMHVAELYGVRVIAVVKHPEQVEAAHVFGAQDVVLLDRKVHVIESVRGLTPNGRGVDVAIEAVASAATWEQAVSIVRKGGLVNFFGGPPRGTIVGLDTNRLHYGDITLKASFHHTPATARTAFDLLTSGRFLAAEYITGRAGLGEVPALFRRMSHRGEAVLRTGISTEVLPPETLALAAAGVESARDIKTAVLPAGVEL